MATALGDRIPREAASYERFEARPTG